MRIDGGEVYPSVATGYHVSWLGPVTAWVKAAYSFSPSFPTCFSETCPPRGVLSRLLVGSVEGEDIQALVTPFGTLLSSAIGKRGQWYCGNTMLLI